MERDFIMYTVADITPEIREKSRMLLGYIKLRIEYKRIDLLRKVYTIQDRLNPILDEVLMNIPDESNIERFHSWESILDDPIVLEAVKQLPQLQQDVLWKVHIEGYKQKEIAQELDISPAAVTKAKKRAHKNLLGLIENQS